METTVPQRRLILRSFQSPGDLVMLTAAVRDLHAAAPGRYVTDVRTSADALFENNPHTSRGRRALSGDVRDALGGGGGDEAGASANSSVRGHCWRSRTKTLGGVSAPSIPGHDRHVAVLCRGWLLEITLPTGGRR